MPAPPLARATSSVPFLWCARLRPWVPRAYRVVLHARALLFSLPRAMPIPVSMGKP